MYRNLNITEKSLRGVTGTRDRMCNVDRVPFDDGMQPPASFTKRECMFWYLLVNHLRDLGLISAIGIPAITLSALAYCKLFDGEHSGHIASAGLDTIMHGFGLDPGGAANMLAGAKQSILDE